MINKGGFLGVVTAVYPEGNCVDVLMKDGGRLYGVQVAVPAGSSGTGLVDLPDVGLPMDESRWSLQAAPEYYMRALVDIYDGAPVVTGFLLPQVTQMTFKQKNRRVLRHASDVYSTIDGNGNIELVHPAGFYIRIGEGSAHEDLTGQDVDRKWKITKNTARAVTLHVQMPGGKAAFNVAPNGDTTYTTQGNINVTAAGDANVTAAHAKVSAQSVTSDSPNTHCTGDLTVDGLITGNAGMAIHAGADGTGASINCSISHTGTFISNGKNIGSDHEHGGVQPGSGTSAGPI